MQASWYKDVEEAGRRRLENWTGLYSVIIWASLISSTTGFTMRSLSRLMRRSSVQKCGERIRDIEFFQFSLSKICADEQEFLKNSTSPLN